MSVALRRIAQEWFAAGRAAMVVIVESARGSTPREEGARMLVSATEIVGTIGGGHLELEAIAEARAMLATGVRRGERFFALGPSLGQCCGGSVTLAWRMLDESAFADWPAPVPLFHLQLHGAGHVGRAVATILSTIDCRVDWIDVRDDRFADSGRAWPDHVRPVTVDSPVAEVAGASRESFFLVMTHSHELDFELVEHILRRDAFGFLGLIGSQTKRARFARRLLDRGFTPAGIERLRCPVGDAGLASKAPELIAVGIVAELVRVADTLRHGAKVQGLQESRR